MNHATEFYNAKTINQYFEFDGKQFIWKERTADSFMNHKARWAFQQVVGKRAGSDRISPHTGLHYRIIGIRIRAARLKLSETKMAMILTGKRHRIDSNGFLAEGYHRRIRGIRKTPSKDMAEIPDEMEVCNETTVNDASISLEIFCIESMFKAVSFMNYGIENYRQGSTITNWNK